MIIATVTRTSSEGISNSNSFSSFHAGTDTSFSSDYPFRTYITGTGAYFLCLAAIFAMAFSIEVLNYYRYNI